MNSINAEQRKEIALNLLKRFDQICRTNMLRYWLAYGTLLGCIRHNGFIPWDDDIDIMMPRPDYEKLCKLSVWTEFNDVQLVYSGKMKGYHRLYARLDDTRTMIMHKTMVDYPNAGVGIDIFPLDGLGNDYIQAVKRVKKIMFLRAMINMSIYKNPSVIYRAEKNPIIKGAKWALAHSKWKNMLFMQYAIQLATKSAFETSYYIGGVHGGERGIMEKEVYEGTIEGKFEGHYFPIPQKYDLYLTNTYGDYMKLPPENQRYAHPDEYAFWKE